LSGSRLASDGGLTTFSRPDPDRLLDRNNEHSTIVDSSGSRFANNGSNRAPDPIVSNYDLKFKLRQKFAELFATVTKGGMIRTPAQHLYFGNSYPFDADFDQRFPNVVQLKGFDDRLDLLHNYGLRSTETVQRQWPVRQEFRRPNREDFPLQRPAEKMIVVYR
jgi:hypothetical protein